MVSRLLIGDNNLSKFWPAYQFSRPSLKLSTLVTATDLDALDSALTQVEEKDQVIVSVLTSVLIDEVNQTEELDLYWIEEKSSVLPGIRTT